MGLNKLFEVNKNKILSCLLDSEGKSRSKIAYETGLHFYVVSDLLKALEKEQKVILISGKNKWRLKQ